ncbi:MAG: EamA family transporter [Solirubrobacteraceae bacterium]
MEWIYVAITIALTIYGQLVVKWQVLKHAHFPQTLSGKLHFYGHLLVNPWIISVFVAAALAALFWMAAMARLQLSQAYPFMALSFVGVLFLSAAFFGEAITVGKVIGIILVVGGLAIGVAL